MSLKLFAKNLRYTMKKNKISRGYLALKINVSHQAVGAWLMGVCYPHHDTLIRLVDALEIRSIDQFIRKDMTRPKSGKVNVAVKMKKTA